MRRFRFDQSVGRAIMEFDSQYEDLAPDAYMAELPDDSAGQLPAHAELIEYEQVAVMALRGDECVGQGGVQMECADRLFFDRLPFEKLIASGVGHDGHCLISI